MRRPLPAAVVGSLLLVAAASAAPRIVAHASSERNLAIVADGAQYRLETGKASRAIELPRSASVDAVGEIGSGWLLAGSAPAEDGADLFFLRGDERGEQRLPPPPGRVARVRQSAVPFVEGDSLLGSAWLEGPEARQYEVRYSRWSGGRFGAPEVVSPKGPGSQLALAGARLADGRELLVWAGYDGKDDEIWFAVRERGESGTWSAPARIADDNDTPDITPAVVAHGNGALVVWSRFDGDEYRLMSARFDGEKPLPARWAGERGSLYPSFERGPAGPVLLFRDARRDGWTVAEIGADGAPGRSARIADDENGRPLVTFDGDSVLWRFGARDAVSSWQ